MEDPELDLENINAPQFVDFSQPLSGEDENVEDYFNYDHENGIPVSFDDTPLTPNSFYSDAVSEHSDTPKDGRRKSSRLAAAVENTSGADISIPKDITCDKPHGDQPKKAPSNICTDFAAWRKGAKIIYGGGKPIRQSPRNQAPNSKVPVSTKTDKSPSLKKLRRSAAPTPESARNVKVVTQDVKNGRHSRTRSVDTSAKTGPLRRSNSLRLVSADKYIVPPKTNSVSTPSSCTNKKSGKPDASKFKGKMTNAPAFMKRDMKFTHTNQPKSTEQLEMEKIKEFQKALAQKRKAQEQFRQKAMAGNACRPLHSVVPLTKPAEFQFKTDERLKNPVDYTKTENKETDFASQLRTNNDPQENKLLPKKTVPQPFSFDRKRKMNSDSKTDASQTKYETDAEKINKFTATPERFRSRPHNKEPSPAKRRRRSMSQPHLTMPKTPNFQTKGRNRPITVKSQEQIEEEEVEEMNKFQFHAKPMNEKIFQNSNMGIKKVPVKQCTVPQSFDLETERRNDTWKNKSHEKEESYQFHANPLPKAILEGTVGVKPAKSIPLTQPESPAFALKNRLRSSIKVPEVLPQEEKKPKAKPPPHNGLPFLPKFEVKATEMKPFSFEERNKRQQQLKEQKIRKMQEEEIKVSEFHANPIPDLSPVLPPKKTKPATKPEPFDLEIDKRGAHKAEEWSSKLKEELRSQREMVKFKAKPNKVINAEPFIPKRSTKPLTVIDDFELNIDARADSREKWEKYKHEKELEEEEEKRQKEKVQKLEEQKEIEKLRKETVVKAQPIRKFKEIEVRPSSKELTQPQTPRFSERLKTKFVR